MNKTTKAALAVLIKATHDARRFVKRNSETFAKYRALEKSEQSAEKAFKEVAALEATPGETVTLCDDEEAKVLVMSPVAGPTYDVAKVFSQWREDLALQVLVVDSAKVEALVKLGVITADHASAYEVEERKALSPRVKIEIK